MAAQAKELAEDALAKATAKREAGEESALPSSGASDPRMGTPYVPGMLGRPGWREHGLTDPAAILPIEERDHAGVPHSTKSEVVEEPFGMGRRWSTPDRSAALFYQLYPEQRAWEPPGGTAPFPDVGGGSTATLPDGRALVFIGADEQRVVLEMTGIDASEQTTLAQTVAVASASADQAGTARRPARRTPRALPSPPRTPPRAAGALRRATPSTAAGASCTRCAPASRGIPRLALQVVIELFEPVRVIEHRQEPRRPREVGALHRHAVEPTVRAVHERARGLLRRRVAPLPPSQQAARQAACSST